MTNFRDIAHMSVSSNIFCDFYLIESMTVKFRPFQTGFRTGMSCAEQIHTLRRIIEGFFQSQLHEIVTFEDFTQLFDSLVRLRIKYMTINPKAMNIRDKQDNLEVNDNQIEIFEVFKT